MSGVLRRIFLRPAARMPVREVELADASRAAGLVGDRAGEGSRQVTLIAMESWRDACADLGRQISPALRRANLLVEGVDLGQAIGRRITISGVEIDVVAELRPCRLMEDAEPGLQRALEPSRRGGVYGRIVRGGRLQSGDRVRITEAGAPAAEQLTLDTAGEER